MSSFRSYWIIFATILLVGVLLFVKKSKFSFTDSIADRVIEKIDANYSPYGPNAIPPGQAPPPPTAQPNPPNWRQP